MKERKIVGVVFDKDDHYVGKTYYYYTDIQFALQDLAVVCTKNDLSTASITSNQFPVVRVVEIEGFTAADRAKAKKWIVQKVDVAGYAQKMEKERMIQEIKADLRALKEEAEELEIYRMLAKGNPAIEEKLNALMDLEGSTAALPAGEESNE